MDGLIWSLNEKGFEHKRLRIFIPAGNPGLELVAQAIYQRQDDLLEELLQQAVNEGLQALAGEQVERIQPQAETRTKARATSKPKVWAEPVYPIKPEPVEAKPVEAKPVEPKASEAVTKTQPGPKPKFTMNDLPGLPDEDLEQVPLRLLRDYAYSLGLRGLNRDNKATLARKIREVRAENRKRGGVSWEHLQEQMWGKSREQKWEILDQIDLDDLAVVPIKILRQYARARGVINPSNVRGGKAALIERIRKIRSKSVDDLTWDDLDRMDKDALMDVPLKVLRPYATHRVGVPRASKIKGGKIALVEQILARR